MSGQVIKAQPGPQTRFQQCQADVAIFGGAAGGGKTFALLMEPLRNVHCPGFGAVVFRRNAVQIREQGGLWDQSERLYPLAHGRGSPHILKWRFPTGAKVSMNHLDTETEVLSWQGSEIPLIIFDELTHFTAKQFWYMLSRNRSTCGVKPHVRASCNPDPDSFVASMVSWWIDPETGFAIPDRSGVVRWFIRVDGDQLLWADSKAELEAKYGSDCDPMSFTFIPSSLQDNQILLKADPRYLSKLKAMCMIDRERLLKGNWKIKAAAGNYFKRIWFRIVDAAAACRRRIRYWDRAATEKVEGNDPDWTVGVLMGKTADGTYVVEDVVRLRGSPLTVEQAIHNTASRDGKGVEIGLEQDPGQAGKSDVSNLIRRLAGYPVRAYQVTKDKETRAKPVSAQCEAGNVVLMRGAWNGPFLDTLENFPPSGDKGHDDDVDALSGAFNALAQERSLVLL